MYGYRARGERRSARRPPPATNDDGALLAAVGEGDGRALAHLYDRHGAHVHGAVCARLDSADDAAAITRQIFLRLWRRPSDSVLTDGSLRAWLLLVADRAARESLDPGRVATVHTRERAATSDVGITGGP